MTPPPHDHDESGPPHDHDESTERDRHLFVVGYEDDAERKRAE